MSEARFWKALRNPNHTRRALEYMEVVPQSQIFQIGLKVLMFNDQTPEEEIFNHFCFAFLRYFIEN